MRVLDASAQQELAATLAALHGAVLGQTSLVTQSASLVKQNIRATKARVQVCLCLTRNGHNTIKPHMAVPD